MSLAAGKPSALPTVASVADDNVLAAWSIGPIIARRTPTSGTLNRVVLVETAGGRYVLRAYRHRERLPVEREHAIIAYACERGMPAVAPLPLPNGDTIFEREGTCYAVFPHAPGQQVARGTLGTSELAAMGRCLAMLHSALQSYPPECVAQRVFTVDSVATLRGIERIEALIRARAVLDDIDQRALAQLAARRAVLAYATITEIAGFAALEQQVIHGDYQESNLFFECGSVVAVIDWENAYVASRAWEIARTLDLVCRFNNDAMHTFLAAYRTVQPLDNVELNIATRQYCLMRLHDLWLYETYYVHGNERLRAFITENNAAAVAERALSPCGCTF